MATHSNILSWGSNGQRSLAGYSPLGCKESDMHWLAAHFLSSLDLLQLTLCLKALDSSPYSLLSLSTNAPHLADSSLILRL